MKKFLILLLSLSLLLVSGCSRKEESVILQEKYPLTVTDMADREVVVSQKPERIVSGYYISTSALIALNQTENLVGIEAKANKRPIYKLSAPELLELPNVGSAKEFDLEGCIALEPDLVVLPLKLKEAARTMEELGIAVLLVNPEDAESLNQMIDLLAVVTDSQDIAQKMNEFNQKIKDYLADSLKNSEKPSVYLAGNSAVLETCGPKMYQNTMIELAGAVNVASDISDTYWANISYEQLLNYDPDYIVLASEASYSEEDLYKDENLQLLRAVQKGHVIALPSDYEGWDSPVPSTVIGSLYLASILHKDAIDPAKCSEMVREYYQTFYNFECILTYEAN